jgi:hypothetical protein
MSNNTIQKQLIPVACDPGNDTIKIIVNNNVQYIRNKLQYSYESRCLFGGDKGNPLDYLDVDLDLYSKGQAEHIFAAELATSDIKESMGGLKCNNETLIRAMIISVAASLVIEYPDKIDFNIKLGTGLPAHEFFYLTGEGKYSREKIETFKEKLCGTHKVKFNSNLFNKKQVTLTIEKKDIYVLPEGFAPLNYLLTKVITPDKINSNDKLKNLNRRGGLNLGLDIGGGSADSAGMKDDKFYTPGIFGIDKGLNNALDKACANLRSTANLISFTRSDFNNILFDPELKGKLYTADKDYDLNQYKQKYYKEVIDQIAYEYLSKLKSKGISTSLINVLFILGGGGSEARKNIEEALKNDIKNIVFVEDLIKDSRSLSALSYYDDINDIVENKEAINSK